MRPLRIRTRLTLVFALAFFAAGLILVAVNYTLVERRLTPDGVSPATILERAGIELLPGLQLPDGTEPGPGPFAFVPITTDGRTLTEVMEAVEEQFRSETLTEIVTASLVAVLVVGAGAAGVGRAVAGRALAPVAAVTATARRSGASNLSERVGLAGPDDEVKELADTFDDMLDRVERGFDAQRSFAALASHELRTPLSVIRVEADNLVQEGTAPEVRAAAGRIRDSVVRSDRLIGQLLAITRSRGSLPEPVAVDLTELVGDVVSAHADEAAGLGVELDLDLGDARVHGHTALLESMVGNLVVNAVVHNVAGGRAAVSVGTTGGRARVVVENGGPVLTADDVERILQPFERLSRSRGHGLGLSVVQEVARAHGADLVVAPRGGGGLRVEVVFPPS